MTQTDRHAAPIVDTSRSGATRLRPVPLDAVQLHDDFWAPRRRINRETTLPSQYRLCEETGRIDNFRRASGKKDIPFQGRYFNDSDVYKWLEAAAWSLAADPDPALERLVDSTIDEIGAAQQPDGYLNTYFMFDKAAERWTNFDLHEMYCAGHLFQAAVAHYRATGSTRLLDIATRFADHICDIFGPEEQGKRPRADGHPEVEMALVELYRATGNRRYLDQTQFLVDVRGRGLVGRRPYDRFGAEYHQDHQPLREMDRMAGHAVRAVYLNAGATDLHAETGEDALRIALDRMWQNMTTRQMYVSGGIGARYEGEALGRDYELPNERAYTETCAAIGNVMWNWRMLALDGDARYADVLERALYNGVLPGLALDGQTYFYQNPLADDGTHRRKAWFGTACCPPNVARLLASLPGYFYSLSDEGVWAHLYAEGTADLMLLDGRAVRLTQHTSYPWDGDISIDVDGEGTFSIFVRIPAWADQGVSLEINGRQVDATTTPGSYGEVRREWKRGDVLRLQLPMEVRRIECHPYVSENAGRVALMRGPLLFRVEAADNRGVDPRDIVLAAQWRPEATFRPELLGGVVEIRGQAQLAPPSPGWDNRLYRVAATAPEQQPEQAIEVTAIPYYAWANREPGRMEVWLRTS